MKKYYPILSILFACLSNNAVYAQQTEQLIQYAKTGDLKILNQYVKANASRFWKDGMPWHMTSELVAGHHEAVLYSRDANPAEESTYIKMLFKDSIIYYYSIHTHYKDNPALSFKILDTTTYNELLSEYRETYNVELNTDELFESATFSIRGCGISGTPPKKLVEMKEMVKRRALRNLNRWLASPIVEKQLYAVDGYELLKHNGISLSRETKRIISVIKQKRVRFTYALDVFTKLLT